MTLHFFSHFINYNYIFREMLQFLELYKDPKTHMKYSNADGSLEKDKVI